MNLKTWLVLSGGAATAAILVAAVVVLTGSESMTRPEPTALDAALVEPDELAPDPAAAGVIIARYGNNLHWLEPSGAHGSVAPFVFPQGGVSPDGRWQAGIDWDENAAFLRIFDLTLPDSPDNSTSLPLTIALAGAEWAPQSARLAVLDGGSLYRVDAATGEVAEIARGITAYAWGSGDNLVYATQDGAASALWRLTPSGEPVQAASLTSPIDRFYVSPGRDAVVYTQDAEEGWRLLSLDPASGSLKDFGHLGGAWRRDYGDGGFDPVSKTAAAQAPQLAVAWSPVGGMFAVGPVSHPYAMHIVAPNSKWQVRTYSFEEGYAGELSWSPDGSRLAISTYSQDRTRHEVYVMDVAAGEAPSHLLDGCRIVWSPDGRFVAVKREPHEATGVAAIRIEDGYHWSLTTYSEYVPLSWGSDREVALSLALQPLPNAIQLGK